MGRKERNDIYHLADCLRGGWPSLLYVHISFRPEEHPLAFLVICLLTTDSPNFTWKYLYLPLVFRVFLWTQSCGWVFNPQHLTGLYHCFLVSLCLTRRRWKFLPLFPRTYRVFPVGRFQDFLFTVFNNLTGMCLCFPLYEFWFCWVSWPTYRSFSWICGYWPLFFVIKYLPYFKSFLLRRHLWHGIRALYIVPEISKALFIFLQPFFSFSDWIICIDLSLGSPIPSISNRLLSQCSKIFISV